MNIYRQRAIHMIVDLINEALDGDGFPLVDLLTDGDQYRVLQEIEDIAMELLDTLPMPKLTPIIPPYEEQE